MKPKSEQVLMFSFSKKKMKNTFIFFFGKIKLSPSLSSSETLLVSKNPIRTRKEHFLEKILFLAFSSSASIVV